MILKKIIVVSIACRDDKPTGKRGEDKQKMTDRG
jgi:hypothetical protein